MGLKGYRLWVNLIQRAEPHRVGVAAAAAPDEPDDVEAGARERRKKTVHHALPAAEPERRGGRGHVMRGGERAVRHALGVAVQVVNLKQQFLKTMLSCHDITFQVQGLKPGAVQAMGPTAFSLDSPPTSGARTAAPPPPPPPPWPPKRPWFGRHAGRKPQPKSRVALTPGCQIGVTWTVTWTILGVIN
jgi:hypothetical protein